MQNLYLKAIDVTQKNLKGNLRCDAFSYNIFISSGECVGRLSFIYAPQLNTIYLSYLEVFQLYQNNNYATSVIASLRKYFKDFALKGFVQPTLPDFEFFIHIGAFFSVPDSKVIQEQPEDSLQFELPAFVSVEVLPVTVPLNFPQLPKQHLPEIELEPYIGSEEQLNFIQELDIMDDEITESFCLIKASDSKYAGLVELVQQDSILNINYLEIHKEHRRKHYASAIVQNLLEETSGGVNTLIPPTPEAISFWFHYSNAYYGLPLTNFNPNILDRGISVPITLYNSLNASTTYTKSLNTAWL